MISHGVNRVSLDRRDYALHRSIGTVAAPQPMPLREYSYDLGKTMPNQLEDGYPYGCTGYTQAEIAGDEDKSIYKPAYTYEKTCMVEGHPMDRGCDIRISLKVGKVYGVQRIDEHTEQEAETHRRGNFFSVDKAQGMDWFDSFRAALRLTKCPISTVTIWFPEWLNPDEKGRLSAFFAYDGRPDDYNWHNYKISGEKTIDGQPHLEVKAWTGRWVYIGRQAFNRAFDIYGTAGFTQSSMLPGDILTIRLTMIEFILYYVRRVLGLPNYS